MVSKPQNPPTRHRDPGTNVHLVELEGSLGRAQWGPTVGPPGSPKGEKRIFSKVVLKPFGMLKQVFVAHFEPVVTRFRPQEIPKMP